MKKNFLVLTIFISAFIASARAQSVGAIQGFCDIGGKQAMTSSLPSSNYLQGIIPNCKVEVFLTGTTTHPTHIYSDALGTVLTNPFKASVIGLTNTGKWTFFSVINQAVDVVLSDGNKPLTYPYPVTWGVDLFPGMVTPGVTAFTPGSNVSCTPLVAGSCTGNVSISALSTMVWPAAGLAASTGTSGPWRTPLYTDVTTLWASGLCNGFLFSDGTCPQPFEHNGTPLPVQNLLNFLDATPSLPASGTANIFMHDNFGGLGSYTPYSTSSAKGTVQPDNSTTYVNNGVMSATVSGAFQTQVVPPLTTQHVIIYPTSGSETSNCSASTYTVGASSGTVRYVYSGSGSCTETLTWNGFTLPSYVVAANVTAVYAFAVTSVSPEVTGNAGGPTTNCSLCSGLLAPAGVNYAWPKQQFTSTTTYTGTSLSSATMTAGFVGSVFGAKTTNMNISAVGLIVYYTGTAPPANTNYLCVAPFYCNPSNLTMGVNLPFDVASDTGSANVLTATVSGYTGLVFGETVRVLANHPTTSATPTFNLNGLGALTILGPTGLPLASGDINTTVSASLRYDNGNWYLQNPQTMQPSSGSGAAQTVVSSATTIAPTTRFFHVSGTTPIVTITAPAFCAVSGTMCQITMIPDGLWTTTTGGNIAIGTTAVVDKTLIMTYDQATSMWYPNYLN